MIWRPRALSGRESSSERPRRRILVDTTFLLPALGVEVEEAMRVIELFRYLEVYYLEAGLFEALWKVLRIVPPNRIRRVEIGIRAIRRTYHLLTPRPEAMVEALKLFREGHRDYIDALHYAVARAEGMQLLTIDLEFIDLLRDHGYEV